MCAAGVSSVVDPEEACETAGSAEEYFKAMDELEDLGFFGKMPREALVGRAEYPSASSPSWKASPSGKPRPFTDDRRGDVDEFEGRPETLPVGLLRLHFDEHPQFAVEERDERE